MSSSGVDVFLQFPDNCLGAFAVEINFYKAIVERFSY